MKPTHQVLIEKIMEQFKPKEPYTDEAGRWVTEPKYNLGQAELEAIYNEFLEELDNDQSVDTGDALYMNVYDAIAHGLAASDADKDDIEMATNNVLRVIKSSTSTADAIFEQAASIETGIHVTVDKIVDDTQTFAFEPQKAAELGYEGVKKLLTAVQDHAIQENREMIRELKNHITILSADVALMNKRLLNLEDQDVKGIKDVITRNLTISLMNHKRSTEGLSHEE
jgi:hypothetical protein